MHNVTQPPLVSIVMAAWNAADVLRDAITSITAQSLTDWELCVVNDASTDETAAVLQDLASHDPRIQVLHNATNSGAGPSRNRSIAVARGRYVAFLDADDQWHPEKLTRQIGWMQANAIKLSCTGYERWTPATNTRTVIGVPATASRAQLLLTNTIACSTAIYDRHHFGPRAMPALRRRQDFAFWLDLLSDCDAAYGLPEVLMTYRQQAGSVSAPKGRAAADTWVMYRQHIGLSRPMAAWVWTNYAARGFLRHRWPNLARRMGWLHHASPVTMRGLP